MLYSRSGQQVSCCRRTACPGCGSPTAAAAWRRVASVCVCVGEAQHMQLMARRDRHCGALRAFAGGFSLATRSASDDTPAARATACSLNWRFSADPDCSIYHRNKDQTAPRQRRSRFHGDRHEQEYGGIEYEGLPVDCSVFDISVARQCISRCSNVPIIWLSMWCALFQRFSGRRYDM